MTFKYVISEMELSLNKAKDPVLLDVRNKFTSFFECVFSKNFTLEDIINNKLIGIYELNTYSDLNSVYSSEGLYIICTDYKMEGNKCSFTLSGTLQGLYRGECSTVKRRIESHLFNKQYIQSYDLRKKQKLDNDLKFSEPYYGACIKIDPEVSGINIECEEYSKSSWTVLVLKMSGSKSEIRKQAELAFDDVFSKPAASREKA